MLALANLRLSLSEVFTPPAVGSLLCMKDIKPTSIDSIVQDVLQLSGWYDVNDLNVQLVDYKQIFSPGLNRPYGVTKINVGGFIGYSAGMSSLPWNCPPQQGEFSKLCSTKCHSKIFSVFGCFNIFSCSRSNRCTANLLIYLSQNYLQMQNTGNFSYFKSEFSCMSAKFSPFDEKRIAISCCDNFGLVGKGKLIILDILPGQMKPVMMLEDHDAIFDCAWTECDPNLILSGCGDGELKLWRIDTGQLVFSKQEHKECINSIECNHQTANLFLSAGMDGFTRLWDLNAQKCVQHFKTHKGQAYQASWHPVQQSMFATVGTDGALRLWDLGQKNHNIASILAHQGEAMSCDFNKYEEQIATASNDKSIKIWDLRNLKLPINVLQGHRYPVRKVKFSPHDPTILASASYDMMVIIWDINPNAKQVVALHSSHTEFVVGVDFSVHIPKLLASVGWDGRCIVWPWDTPQPTI